MKNIILIKQSNTNQVKKMYNNFISKNKVNNFELFILTTAITRYKLHNISFNNYKKFIPRNIPIKWIINIDYVNLNNNSSEDALNITKQNIL